MPALPRVCGKCGAIVPDGHYYCGRCGSHYVEGGDVGSQTLFYGPIQAPGRAKLIVICGEAIEGISYHLNATHHVSGRNMGVIPFEDSYISENHADFYYEDNQLYIRDEGSVNGTFLRIRDEQPLEDGDIIRAGQQLFRFERLNLDPPYALEDGTVHYSSPSTTVRFRVSQILDDGYQGQAYASPHGEVSVGREGCDLSFTEDGNLSRRHFKVTIAQDGSASLVDLDSRNGTFMRLKDSVRLRHGDYVFIGKQLLRVEING